MNKKNKDQELNTRASFQLQTLADWLDITPAEVVARALEMMYADYANRVERQLPIAISVIRRYIPNNYIDEQYKLAEIEKLLKRLYPGAEQSLDIFT